MDTNSRPSFELSGRNSNQIFNSSVHSFEYENVPQSTSITYVQNNRWTMLRNSLKSPKNQQQRQTQKLKLPPELKNNISPFNYEHSHLTLIIGSVGPSASFLKFSRNHFAEIPFGELIVGENGYPFYQTEMYEPNQLRFENLSLKIVDFLVENFKNLKSLEIFLTDYPTFHYCKEAKKFLEIEFKNLELISLLVYLLSIDRWIQDLNILKFWITSDPKVDSDARFQARRPHQLCKLFDAVNYLPNLRHFTFFYEGEVCPNLDYGDECYVRCGRGLSFLRHLSEFCIDTRDHFRWIEYSLKKYAFANRGLKMQLKLCCSKAEVDWLLENFGERFVNFPIDFNNLGKLNSIERHLMSLNLRNLYLNTNLNVSLVQLVNFLEPFKNLVHLKLELDFPYEQYDLNSCVSKRKNISQLTSVKVLTLKLRCKRSHNQVRSSLWCWIFPGVQILIFESGNPANHCLEAECIIERQLRAVTKVNYDPGQLDLCTKNMIHAFGYLGPNLKFLYFIEQEMFTVKEVPMELFNRDEEFNYWKHVDALQKERKKQIRNKRWFCRCWNKFKC